MYSFENSCMQDDYLKYEDGTHTICLSACGENDEEVPEELVKFLEYVRADLSTSMNDFDDTFVTRLQESVHHIKVSREMEERYMLFEELLRTERKEGKIEDRVETITELLEELGTLPKDLKERLESESNLETLRAWCKIAAKAESIDQFMQAIREE